jgi:type VI secretion system protein ImpB
MDLRTRLSDLRGALQTNEKLDDILLDAVKSTEKLDRLKKEIEGEKGPGGSE